MTSYVETFMAYKCCPDIMSIARPVTRPAKEISESMALIKIMRRFVLKDKMKYVVVDLCAGNALTGLMSVFLLPVKGAIAVDKNKHERTWHLARNFNYIEDDIYGSLEWFPKEEDVILISSHPCKDLAVRIIDIYKTKDNCKALIMMPCCKGAVDFPQVIQKKLGKYLAWSFQLSLYAKGNIVIDKRCLSPCNAIVVASKKRLQET